GAGLVGLAVDCLGIPARLLPDPSPHVPARLVAVRGTGGGVDERQQPDGPAVELLGGDAAGDVRRTGGPDDRAPGGRGAGAPGLDGAPAAGDLQKGGGPRGSGPSPPAGAGPAATAAALRG